VVLQRGQQRASRLLELLLFRFAGYDTIEGHSENENYDYWPKVFHSDDQ
jgi:hypothetical protein